MATTPNFVWSPPIKTDGRAAVDVYRSYTNEDQHRRATLTTMFRIGNKLEGRR